MTSSSCPLRWAPLQQRHVAVRGLQSCRHRVPFTVSSQSRSVATAVKAKRIAGTRPREPLVLPVLDDGSDTWRLQPVIDLLLNGGVGIIPTDTLPAIVCDLENRDAVLRLYAVKGMDPKKPLSLLCRDFRDISHYTSGFPNSNIPGQPNFFNLVRRLLPGPYTFILPATKNLPSQCIDFMKGKNIHRKSVGVRLSSDPVCKAVLAGMGRPLLCTSVHVPEHLSDDTEVPDMGQMLEEYGNKGIDFIVDVGPRVAVVSSIVDLTGPEPEVLRVGQGDVSMFEA